MQAMSEGSLRLLPEFISQELSNLSWAFSKVVILDRPLLAAIACAAIARSRDLSPQDLSSIAWSVAVVALTNDPLLDAIAARAMPRIGLFEPQGLTNMAWAFASIRFAHMPLLDAIASGAMISLRPAAGVGFIPRNVSMLAWSFASFALQHEPLLQALSAAAMRMRTEFATQNLANMAWSLAKLLCPDDPLLEAISEEARAKIQEFGGQGLSNIAWAFATLLFHDLPLMESLSAASMLRLCDYCTQQLSNTAWAFSKLLYTDVPLMDSISAASLRRLSEFSQQDLSSTAWAFATIEMRNDPLLEAIAAEAVPKIAVFEPLGLMCTAWAFAVVELRNQPLLHAISEQSINRCADLDAQALSLIAWAFASMRVFDAPLLAAIAAESIRKSHLLELHHLSKLVWSLSFVPWPFDTKRVFGHLVPLIMCQSSQMSSVAAHSILWGLWHSGGNDLVAQLLLHWKSESVDDDDLVGAADLLLTDVEWRRGSEERGLLEMVEATTATPSVQGVVSKWARGYVADESIVAHVWDQDKVERNRPELAKYLSHFPEMSKWSQPGSGNHWRKLGSLVEHVDALVGVPTDPKTPHGMLRLIERFAEGAHQWLKVAGGAKANLLSSVFCDRSWEPWEFSLECGAFVGYTSIRFAAALRGQLGRGRGRAVSVEVDPVQACIARHFLDLAGCSEIAEVWVGQFRDVLPRAVEEFGVRALGLAFLDYKGTIFHIDLASLERLLAFAPGGIAVADNVVLPGAPLYLWVVTRHIAWATTVWALQEFLEPNVEDWMCVSEYCAPLFPEVDEPPVSWQRLSWHTDHMRRRAQGMRPGENLMAEQDRVSYARYIRSIYRDGGVDAQPWADVPHDISLRSRHEYRTAAVCSTQLPRPAWGGLH
mmetsp:Transcript_62829/g.205094  ORF Transcript_62829/g.205094 Transcript_62829/m.205094 type:complete len:881 (+) Transcript_62829:1687-4329(+)